MESEGGGGEGRRPEKGERHAREIRCFSESAGQGPSMGVDEGGREGGREGGDADKTNMRLSLPSLLPAPQPLCLPSPANQAPSDFPVITPQTLHTQQHLGDAEATNSRGAPCVTLNPAEHRSDEEADSHGALCRIP
jgi:hypothetical protein